MDTSEVKKVKKVKKARCSFCNKKIGLISFPCDCGGIFCQIHRYTHMHECKRVSDKKEKNKENIIVNNPKVDFKKMEKI
tara:strand:+ start:215 stop:451 length:237 start_codon:yes stop_codon:yes gene_type:complete